MMKRRKRNCLLRGIWLVAAVCVAAGCAASPAGHNSADVESETYEESAAVKLSETNGEAAEPLAAGLQKPETVDELASPSEEEIAALGIREDMLAYWMVLNSKKPFVSMNEDGQKFYWNEYNWCLGRPVEQRQADYFMIVDMNGDGANEIVLGCSPESTQVLHYEDGEVYSYQFVFRGMKRIRSNGIYEGSDGASSTFYYRLTELNKDGYKEETIAVMDGDYYEVEGNEAAYEEFCDYVDPIESVALADCMEFTESMLDRQLLGNLSEQELALLKRIPEENLPESEPDYQESGATQEQQTGKEQQEKETVWIVEEEEVRNNPIFAQCH